VGWVLEVWERVKHGRSLMPLLQAISDEIMIYSLVVSGNIISDNDLKCPESSIAH